MPQNAKNYTDPELREQVKNEVQQGDKGGKPGQWSARKAQMTASEYKARGGDYTTSKDEKKSEQKHLDKWTNEEWQTKEGSGTAKQDDGTRKRYLPKKAWEELDEREKKATEQKKLEGSKAGKQFVANTGEAKRKRGEVSREGEKKGSRNGGKDKKGGQVDRKKEKEGKMKQEPEENGENGENEEEEVENTENDEDYERDGEDLDGENEESGDNSGSEDEDEEQNQQADEKETETDTPEGEQPEKKRQKQD